jgi:hypothetical protein
MGLGRIKKKDRWGWASFPRKVGERKKESRRKKKETMGGTTLRLGKLPKA